MEFILTAEMSRRINNGIAEAQKQIDREMTYSPNHRNAALIAQCEAHIAKMAAALEAGVLCVSA